MKIVINLCPPYQTGTMPPLGLGYLKAILKEKKHQPIINDINTSVFLDNKELFEELLDECKEYLSENKFLIYTYSLKKLLVFLYPKLFLNDKNEIIKRINADINIQIKNILVKNPDVICFSVFFTNIYYTAMLARRLRIESNAKIIFGGPLCNEKNADIFLKLGLCDYVVKGEGEISFQKLIDNLKNDYKKKSNLTGVSYTQGKEIIHTSNSKLITVLEEIPLPEFDNKNYEILPIITSRGCIKKCSFCAETNQWEYYRRRKIDEVVKEIKKRIKENNTREFDFCDSLLNASNDYFEELCEKITPLRISWSGFLRCEKLNKELIRKIKKSGCKQIAFGIESFNQEILDSINKQTKTEEMMQILKDLHEEGVDFMINLIIGYPGETEYLFFKNLEYTLKVINQNKDFFFINTEMFKLYPGSNIMNKPEKYGITLISKKEPLPKELSFLQEDYNNFFTEWKVNKKPSPQEFYERVKFMTLMSTSTSRRTFYKKEFIIINNDDIENLIYFEKKLDQKKEYFFEFRIKGEFINQEIGLKIIAFLDVLKEKNIDYKINKTLPPCIFDKKPIKISIPQNCFECKEVFIDSGEKISLCSRKMNQFFKENKTPKSPYFNENNLIFKCEKCSSCRYRIRGLCNYIYC